MPEKPSYEMLEQRIKKLEGELAVFRSGEKSNLAWQYLNAILENTNLPIYLKDQNFKYIHINREYERLANVTNEEIEGKEDFDIFPPPVAQLFRSQDEEVIQQNTLLEFTETIPLADGEHTFLTSKFPLRNEQGSIYAIGGVCTDITALLKTESSLLESESRYRSFIKNFHGIAYRIDISTLTPIFFHGAVEDITGYTEKDFIAGNPRWDAMVHPDDTSLLRTKREEILLAPCCQFKHEYRILSKDGKVKWIFERGQSLCDESNRPIWYEGSIFDISNRKKMENALRESEEKYRTLVETASLGIQISDLEGKIILSNRAHHAIQGYADGEIIGKYLWDFVDNEQEKAELKAFYNKIIEEQPPPAPHFESNRTMGGRDILVQVDWNYMRDANSNVYAICSIIKDVTDRLRTEKALKASEKKFRSVIESCPVGMMLYKLEPENRLVFVDANPAADKILGVDHSQFVGKTIEEAFPSLAQTEIPERYREVCRAGKPWRTEQLSYEDEQISGAFDVHAFQTEPGKMALFFSDITSKIRLQVELQKIQKLESVGILAGGIAHDFNNLLTAILGNISMAKIFAQPEDKVQERLLDAEKAAFRAQDLTQQLLTFSKGGAPIKCAVSISDLILESTSFMLSGSNVKCDFESDEGLWPVNIDEGQISQVIQNIVKNADQAMPDGGIIRIKAHNRTISTNDHIPLKSGKYIHISITDEGVGIHQRHLARIFDPYFSTKQEGSGLGLAASFSIIKNHDGFLSAESEQGVGSTFHLYLPASEAEPPTKKPSRAKVLRSGENILIMDDDPDVLTVAENMLNLMGYKAETAVDGTEAVGLYKKAMEEDKPFDAVILDLTIPGGMGGKETVRQLAALDPDVKAIVSSGYANDPIMSEYTKYGFQGVVSKPYDMEKLGLIIRKLFD